VSWGLTAINPDVSDVFVEFVNDIEHYLGSNEKWMPFAKHTEKIKVRFGSDVELQLRFTRNGVVISDDLLEGAA